MASGVITQFAELPVPDHVDPDLVRRDFPFIYGTITEQNPFNDLVMKTHEEEPDIFYAPHAYPGGTAAWVPRRMALMREVFMDTEHFTNADFGPYAKLAGGNWINSPAELDPPAHGPFRQMANPAFTPKAMAALEDKIRSYAAGIIDAFVARGSCEFMSEFAFEFPIKIFLELMGLPQDRVGEFLSWERDLIHNFDLARMADSTRRVIAYLDSEIEARRSSPRNDLMSFALQSRIGDRPLTDDELRGFSFNLFIGGLDTVSTNLGLQFWHLATHPDDQAFLRSNPQEIPHAIDELMRANGAVTTFRTCKKETKIGGARILPGDKVALSTSLAGRDPAEFNDPQDVRFGRRPRHIGFGFGIHTCMGMHLARRELRVAIEEFLARIPEFRIADGHTMRFHLGMIQPVELPLTWQSAN